MGGNARLAESSVLGSLPRAVAAYIDSIVDSTRRVLADDLVGMYSIGSIALGDFKAATSDVDVIVVTSGSLPLDRRHALADAVAALAVPVRGLEYVVYPRESLR